tara:strand:- start:113 stop:1435 length:1323 start_codon:yes stop_codon:yes gene_type:complete
MELNLVGDFMLDEYEFYSISRISPEASVPVLIFDKYNLALGGSGNLAGCLSLLGFKINLFGVCSSESFSEIEKLCLEYKINTDFLFKKDDIVTTRKLRILGDNQQICRIDKDSFLNKKNLEDFAKHLKKNINNESFIVLSDYAKGTSDIFLENSDIKSPKYIDPKYPDWSRYYNCEFLKANDIEFNQALVFSNCKDAHELIKKFNISNLIVTRGEKGCSFYSNDLTMQIKGIPTEVKDVTGAGDSFMASFIWANEFGYDIENSLNFANATAACSVSYVGSYTPNYFEILDRLNKNLELDINKDIFKYKKVLIGGCFDCLHAGHIFLFSEAIRLAKTVIIAINSDSSVSKLKGKSRPFQDIETRVSNIKKLGIAANIVVFDEDSPIKVLEEAKPDVFLKGGDYNGDEDFEDFNYCKENDIDLYFVATKEGFSSTRIIDEIK